MLEEVCRCPCWEANVKVEHERSDDLTSAQERVFFAPASTRNRLDGGKETVPGLDEEGDELSSIAESVAPHLRFFDDTCLPVRVGGTRPRDYNALAQRLAPASGGGLVRRPRQEELINDALIPALEGARGDSERALALLYQALLWLDGMPQKSKQRVRMGDLLVPAAVADGQWKWVKASDVYLSAGWADNDAATVELLTRAFGGRPACQLVTWEQFRPAAEKFKEVERAWWSARLQEIGVANSPRILRKSLRACVAYVGEWQRLPRGDVLCPVPCPETIWQSYLTEICKRKVHTQRPQEYFLHEVTWIDGLENADIRREVVEAMLRNPSRYEACLTDRFSREAGHQPTAEPSLWRCALLSQHWPVIPTTTGPTKLERRPPEEAWFLSQDLRSTREDRYAFLACVPVWLGAARNLLSALGVVTVDQAPVQRLIAALHEVASQISGASPASLRHIEAMATDLFAELQARMKGGEPASTLLSLAKKPVPLLRDERITAADLTEIDCLLVDDDPIRRQRLHQYDHGWFLPKRFRQTYNELIAALRACLSPKTVIRVSECALELNFQTEAEVNLLDFLEGEFAGKPLVVDLGLLIVKCGVVAASPHEETFAFTWRIVKQTRLARGRFANEVAGGACFDAQHAGGPVMMAESTLNRFQIVAEMWQLVGTAYQHAWRAYARALEEGKTAAFFGQEGVTPAERTEVEAVVGGNFTQRLGRFRPVFLARWMQIHAEEKAERFAAEWTAHTLTPELAKLWLVWPELEADVRAAVQAGEPEGSLKLLERMKIPVSDWQNARRNLGESPLQFERSREVFSHACRILAGRCRAWFAWLVVPRSQSPGSSVDASLADTVFDWTEQIQQLQPPPAVCEVPWEISIIAQKASREVLRLAAAFPSLLKTGPLVEPLQELALAGSNLAELKLRSEPDAAATIYERDVEEHRNREAAKAIDIVIKIASALAAYYNELLDEEKIRQSTLVRLLGTGRWANRYSVLAAVRGALQETAPQTTARMQKAQAFRPVEDWQSLWRRFEMELGVVAKPTPVQPSPTEFSVLSGAWTHDEFLASAAEGDVGVLAKQLAQAVRPALDLRSLQLTRGKVEVRVPSKGGRKSKGGGGGKRPPDEYLKMLGAVGEYFVYRQFKEIIPDFSLENWKSRNREVFGAEEGNDSLGYDFEFYDARGALDAARVPRQYFLEVKSAASADCGEDFEMSMNEWETARLHTASTAGWNGPLYLIVRVAGTASTPRIVDLLMDPVALRAQGVLDYSSRDLIISVGEPE